MTIIKRREDLLKLIGNFNGTVYYHRNEDEKENIRIFKKNFKDEKTGEYKQEYEFVLNSVKVNQEGISSATDFSIKKNRNDLKKLSEIIGTVANTSNDKNFNEGLSLNRASLTSQLAEDKSKYGFSTLFLTEISPILQYSGNESAIKTENFNYIFSNSECNMPFKMNFEKNKYIISNDNLVLKKNGNFISLYDLNSNSVYENGVIRSEENGFERKLCSNLKKLEFLNAFQDKKNFEKFIENLSQKVISPENKRASLTDNDKKQLENFKEGLEKFEFLKEDVNGNKLKNDFINLFSDKLKKFINDKCTEYNIDLNNTLGNGTIYYLNGKNGTDAAWSLDGATCDFVIFTNDIKNLLRIGISSEGKLRGSYWGDEENVVEFEGNEVSTVDLRFFVNALYINCDLKNIENPGINELNFKVDTKDYFDYISLWEGQDEIEFETSDMEE